MPESQTVVIRVAMHCQGCRLKVKKTLCKIPGVEEFKVDFKEQKVTIRGNVDLKVVMKLLAKTGKVNEIITPAAAPITSITTASKLDQAASQAPVPISAPAPASTAIPPVTKEAILKDLQLAPPVVWIDNPYILSDENPNACSIM